jgi:hypothetical protein
MTFTKNKPSLEGHPLLTLPPEDLDLITELVLRSGSLKDLAESYGVSYPTIRLRLDRLIDRLKAALKGRSPDPMNELLARLVERGEMSASGARAVRDLARKLATPSPAAVESHDDPKGGAL